MALIERPTTGEEPPRPQRSWSIDIDGVTVEDLRPLKWQLYLAFVGFGVGALAGILQALERLDANLYDEVGLDNYYQGLTLHGVAMVLVFTFTFSNAFISLMTMRAFGRPLAYRRLSEASTWCAWLGVALAVWAILANKATVLFTFYPPLEATPAFYFGAVLLVISTWLVLANMLLTLREWRKDHPDERIPLLGFVCIMTYLMWAIASVGIAIEVLAFILPWTFGWTTNIDPQFTRVLFWFTGHPIVYFWLLPIYVSWYTLLPRQVGSRTYSDGLTRMVFISFLLLIPVGVHHQFTDPGIPFSSKTIQWALTFAIFYPSMVTAFTVFAALEDGGRKAGGKGWIGWIWKLPWGNPVVAGQLLAGLGFMLGGASGLINASYTVNLVVHNTSFIVGHFHLTVGTAVALAIMAISYWMVPYLTGRALWGRRIALTQEWLWIVGVFVFARGQMQAGIEGMPRRTQIQDAPYLEDHGSWDIGNLLTGIGGSVMFISAVLFFVVIFGTIFNSRQVAAVEVPVADVVHGPRRSWALLDDIKVWVAVAVILSLIIYGEVILHYLPLHSVSPGFQLW